MKIAIAPDLLQGESFSARWVERLEALGHTAEVAAPGDPDFLERVQSCDGFLWWFPPLPFQRELGRRVLMALDHATNLVVHPDWRSCWHFDDKIAQTWLLRAAGIPMPRTDVFWKYEEAMQFLRDAAYPMVVKLSFGYRGERVGLLRNRAEAEWMAHRLFGEGVSILREPSLHLLRGIARPVRRWFRRRVGKSPLPLYDTQRNCMLVQELVPGNDYDTRANVIGDRIFAWRRWNAPNDFRASGANRQDFDVAKVDHAAIRLAHRVVRALGMHTASVDMLQRDGEFLVTEVSFWYEPMTMRRCSGYWRVDDGEVRRVEGTVEPEAAILDDFLLRVAAARRD